MLESVIYTLSSWKPGIAQLLTDYALRQTASAREHHWPLYRQTNHGSQQRPGSHDPCGVVRGQRWHGSCISVSSPYGTGL